MGVNFKPTNQQHLLFSRQNHCRNCISRENMWWGTEFAEIVVKWCSLKDEKSLWGSLLDSLMASDIQPFLEPELSRSQTSFWPWPEEAWQRPGETAREDGEGRKVSWSDVTPALSWQLEDLMGSQLEFHGRQTGRSIQEERCVSNS